MKDLIGMLAINDALLVLIIILLVLIVFILSDIASMINREL